MGERLRMVKLRADTARLVQEGVRRRLPMQEVDMGYLVHGFLEDMFGPGALRPFFVPRTQERMAELLGYTRADEAALRDHAQTFASPAHYAAVDWSSFAVKELPERWVIGRRLGFKVQVCPTVRRSGRRPEAQKGEEVDAYLSACWGAPQEPKPDRAAVYARWLQDRLEGWGVSVGGVQMSQFQLVNVMRRTQGEARRGLSLRLPSAVMEGELTVQDSERFAELLAHGVGRHRAFGFGMLLLSPPRSAGC